MGVIYSSHEVAHGNIPTEGAHLSAAETVRNDVCELEEVSLTVIHGSVPEYRSNIRSDLDVLVTYDVENPADEPLVVRKINGVLDMVSRSSRVHIEANVWPAGEAVAARRERMYDLLFSRHLARAAQDETWARGNVDPTLLEVADSSYGDDEMLRRIVLNYTTYKHAGFVKAPAVFAEDDKVFSAMQRALEFPKSAGRKVEQLLGLSRDATSEENWQTMVESGMSGYAMEAMMALHCIDQEYTGIVENVQPGRRMFGERELASYTQWLRRNYAPVIDLGIVAASGFTNFIAEEV